LQFGGVLKNPTLVKLDMGIFTLHMVMTALFVVTPIVIVNVTGWTTGSHWKIYVPVLILSVAGMLPLVQRHSEGASLHTAFVVAIAILAASQGTLLFSQHSLPWLLVSLWLFFVGFNSLEAMLPSQVSRSAPVQHRGAALGVYSTTEYLGVFAGGTIGGWLHDRYGIDAVYLFGLAAVMLWLLVVAGFAREAAVETDQSIDARE
jgi:predicted MFS family arabinose efflux permease